MLLGNSWSGPGRPRLSDGGVASTLMTDVRSATTVRRRLLPALTILTSFVVALGAAELTLRVYGRWQARGHPDYPDTMREGGLGPGGYLKERFDAHVLDGLGGAVRWVNNTQGFRRHVDVTREPLPGTLRILSLGDSFTAGYRVAQADTFSFLIEQWAAEALGPTEVLISAIESPQEGLEYLRQNGLGWNPRIVLFGVTLGNDIAQAYISRAPTTIGFTHGLEKMDLPEASLVTPTGLIAWRTRLTSLAARSRVVQLVVRPRRAIVSWYGRTDRPKLFDAINGLGMYLKDPPDAIDQAYARLFAILSDAKSACDVAGVHLAVLVFPQRFQVQPADWTAASATYHLRPDAFDLMQPNRRIGEWCDANGIPCIDPTDAMRAHHVATGEELYLPLGDMHWSAAGHHAWFAGARRDLERLLRGVSPSR